MKAVWMNAMVDDIPDHSMQHSRVLYPFPVELKPHTLFSARIFDLNLTLRVHESIEHNMASVTEGGTVTDAEKKLRDPHWRIQPSETEVAQLIEEARLQYEECMRLADLADISDRDETSHPRYAWDNPIGLVVTESSNAELV